MLFCIFVAGIAFIAFFISGIKTMINSSIGGGVLECIFGLFGTGAVFFIALILSMCLGGFLTSAGIETVYDGSPSTRGIVPVAEDYYVIARKFDDNEMEYEYSPNSNFITSVDTAHGSEVYFNYIDEDEEPSILTQNYEFKNPIWRFFAIGPLKFTFNIPENSVLKTCTAF